MSLKDRVNGGIKSAAMATMFAASSLSVGTTNAGDDVHNVSAQSEPISFVSDVDASLKTWTLSNPDSVAVGVKLSKTFPLSPEEIGKRLQEPALKECADLKTHFMFEVDNQEGIVFSLRYNDKLERSIPVEEIKHEIAEAAGHVCLTKQLARN